MSKTVLKKEFKKKDVNRIRNLISKKYGDKISQSVGYEKNTQKHVEGDIWEENGKTWTIKKGIKQNVTKLDGVKKSILFPILCPNCHTSMTKKLDKKFFNIHNKCMDCVIEYEAKLKYEGKYEEYEKSIIQNNITSYIKDARNFIENMGNENESSFITEQGDIEKWDGGNIQHVQEKMLKELNDFEDNALT